MKTMHMILGAALVAVAMFSGCKMVRVTNRGNDGWIASYISVFQANDVKGLRVKAGDSVALDVEQTKSAIDPAAADALRTAAAALAVASRACAACASGGASEAVTAAAAAAATCADGGCNP